jgi:hypothetical protein
MPAAADSDMQCDGDAPLTAAAEDTDAAAADVDAAGMQAGSAVVAAFLAESAAQADEDAAAADGSWPEDAMAGDYDEGDGGYAGYEDYGEHEEYGGSAESWQQQQEQQQRRRRQSSGGRSMLGLGDNRVSGDKLGYKRCMQEFAWKVCSDVQHGRCCACAATASAAVQVLLSCTHTWPAAGN